ncbi:MAG: AIPR family protein [Leptospiraceae bacterium]|nr:AIPR family protein [Leptospiraceae bacterium]
MYNTDFYQILDTELSEIAKKYESDEEIKKRKENDAQLKSYCLMVWFLEFYGKIIRVKNEIVDGPGDSSCDIIFQKMNFLKETIFYVVQSKWNVQSKADKMMESDEIKKALSDFQTILNGEKLETKNPKFNESFKSLKMHINQNGKVEFVFLSLSKSNPSTDENIQSFQNNNPNMFVRIFDIDYIKRDFIDVHYKKLEKQNLLERKYNPKEEEITITIERLGPHNNQIHIQNPFTSYIVLVRPKLLFELFERYGYSLFIENVRNPIKGSEINEKMQETLLNNPAFFWYYNNGITAISKLLPVLSKQAKEFMVTGFQVINGAQTVYAIHSAYSKAAGAERKKMDQEVLITLRLYKSGGTDFDRNVTKYTNAQNIMNDRDFRANDSIQIRLQNESFSTKYWYEKRKDEFVNIPEGIIVISNETMIKTFIAFFDLSSYMALKDFGLFDILNDSINYKSLVVSYLVYLDMERLDSQYTKVRFFLLGLFKLVMESYLGLKYSKNTDVVEYLYNKYEKEDLKEIQKVILYIYNFIKTRPDLLDKVSSGQTSVTENQELKNLEFLLTRSLKVDDVESISLNEVKEAQSLR